MPARVSLLLQEWMVLSALLKQRGGHVLYFVVLLFFLPSSGPFSSVCLAPTSGEGIRMERLQVLQIYEFQLFFPEYMAFIQSSHPPPPPLLG